MGESISRAELARQITLIESTAESDRKKALSLLSKIAGNSREKTMRLGISGVPGVGKSSLIERLGLHLVKECGRRPAVLAVDPSSPVRGGSLLGDRVRMNELKTQEQAFIRPSPSGNNPGGVARSTREVMLLVESAGYDALLVETVGVGQSEYEVGNMVDLFILLLQPGMGDEVQTSKRGIMELADIVVVNKNDGDYSIAAKQTMEQCKMALSMNAVPRTVPVLLCSALTGKGIAELWDVVQRVFSELGSNGELARRRGEQRRLWLNDLLAELVWRKAEGSPKLRQLRKQCEQEMLRGKITPHEAARRIVEET